MLRHDVAAAASADASAVIPSARQISLRRAELISAPILDVMLLVEPVPEAGSIIGLGHLAPKPHDETIR